MVLGDRGGERNAGRAALTRPRDEFMADEPGRIGGQALGQREFDMVTVVSALSPTSKPTP
jgi:hypothetical protein